MTHLRVLIFVAFACSAFAAPPHHHATVDSALAQAHALLTGRFLCPEGLFWDYVGEIPTPQDCADGRPNAKGWNTPISNGPMFTGQYLWAMCIRAKRTGEKSDVDLCRRLAGGLIRAASVSDVKGMIVRGFATDGRAHYPLGSDDQTLPWFLGLHAWVRSGFPSADEKAAAIEKMTEAIDAFVANGWRPLSDGAFKGMPYGCMKRGAPFRSSVGCLYIMRAMDELTGDGKWRRRYAAALTECPSPGRRDDLTRAAACEAGYAPDTAFLNVEPGLLWIYTPSTLALKELCRMETDPALRARYRKGLQANADRAAKFLAKGLTFANTRVETFKAANWRTGYTWEPQKTFADIDRVNKSANPEILGTRKQTERNVMVAPLSAAVMIACANDVSRRADVETLLRHFDYSVFNIVDFFLAETAWFAFD